MGRRVLQRKWMENRGWEREARKGGKGKEEAKQRDENRRKMEEIKKNI